MFCGVQREQVDVVVAVEEVRSNDWREVDRTLKALAKQRAALDVEEARWLRAAARLQIWNEIGCVSMLDYMERRLGYGPRAAQERLRVAFALEQLPALEQALENGELPFTGARELSRVMTPETEQQWLDAAQNKNVHEIEGMVAGHEKGDLPEDPPNPELVMRVLRYLARPATAAMEKPARAALEKHHGMKLDEDGFLAALFRLALGVGNENGEKAEDTGRARYQISTTLCRQCERGWQNGAEIGAADVERAKCDAQWIGDVDAKEPARASQKIPPRVRRLVLARDGSKCIVPGCRSTLHLEVHHLEAKEDGGSDEMANLGTLCDAHHIAQHRGLLRIRGKAPDRLTFDRQQEAGTGAHVGAPTQLQRATMRVEAKAAIVKLGFKRAEAASAVEAANQHLGPEITLEHLIREALRRLGQRMLEEGKRARGSGS